MTNKNPTQCDMIRDWLDQHGSITQYEALNQLGIMRLASRVSEMNKDARVIDSEWTTVKNRYEQDCEIKRYFWAKEKAV